MGGRTCLAAVLVAAATAGCGDDGERAGDGTPAPARDQAATPTATATPPAPRPPEGRTLRFRTSDGKPLRGVFRPASERAPAVVLSHGWRAGPDQFDELAAVLNEAGYASLAYTSHPRGQLDETLLARDIVGAVRALRRQPEVERDRIGLVGASIGGSAATWVIGGMEPPRGVRAAIGLSAPEGAPMIEAGTEGRFKPRDLLLITDRREADNARNISMDAGGRGVEFWIAPEAGHGVELVPQPEVQERLLAWLDERLR